MCAKRASAKREPSDLVSRAPERTCIACRSVANRDSLVRLVIDTDGRLIVDLRRDRPGRGAWVHATRACVRALDEDPQRVTRALKKAPAGRSASRKGGGERGGIEQQLRARSIEALSEGLARAHTAGMVISDPHTIEDAIEQGQIAEVLVASDAPGRAEEILTVRDVKLDTLRLPIDGAALGAILGLAPRAVVGLLRSDAFLDLRSQLRLLCSMG